MDIDLSDRTAFVTGGSKGIGQAIAAILIACRANVGIMARGKEGVDSAIVEVMPPIPIEHSRSRATWRTSSRLVTRYARPRNTSADCNPRTLKALRAIDEVIPA